MVSYSTDYLFHFTGRDKTPEESCEALLGIIEYGFRFNSNHREELEYIKTLPEEFRVKIDVPVVCFTEIPLKFIRPHSARYGRFGIGVSKEWAISNHAQPLIYIDRNSMGFGEGLRILLRRVDNRSEVSDALGLIMPFIRELDFHEEREWRFISPLSGSNYPDGPVTVSSPDYLRLERQDIKNIVVPENYHEAVEASIRHLFSIRYGDDSLNFPVIVFENIAE